MDRLVDARFGIVSRDRSSREKRRSPPNYTGRHFNSIAPLFGVDPSTRNTRCRREGLCVWQIRYICENTFPFSVLTYIRVK